MLGRVDAAFEGVQGVGESCDLLGDACFDGAEGCGFLLYLPEILTERVNLGREPEFSRGELFAEAGFQWREDGGLLLNGVEVGREGVDAFSETIFSLRDLILEICCQGAWGAGGG